MQLHSEGWEREEAGRERGAAWPAEGMRVEARANTAPSLKLLPGQPTTGPAKPGSPAPWRYTLGLHRRVEPGGVWVRLSLVTPPSSSRLPHSSW